MPNLRIIGEVQTGQAEARIAALTRQVEALNVAMAKSASIPAGGTPAGFTKTTAALSAAGRAYNEALAASGEFRVQNLKVNDVLAQQTDLLRRQKLSYRDIWGGPAARKRMQAIKREQIAMKNMTVRAVEGTIGDGHLRATMAIPADVPKSWDNWRNSVGMLGNELASANRVLLNWGKNTQWAGRQLMAGITYPVVAFGAAAGVMAYKVDKELTRVQKVYNTTADATSKNIKEIAAAETELAQLRNDSMKTGIDAAKQYGAAINETLAVQADLAATGQKGAALQGATTEVMKNAMLGEIDYQTTTKATIALQQQLHLSTQELGDTWAYLNSMENQTSLTMQDFASAIPIALGPLKQMGGTVQDLGTLLTAMVSRGVQVGKAANAIKATAQRLLRPSAQVAAEFRAITGADIKEIAASNEGNMMGIMQDLYEVTKDLTEYDKSKAFAGLFGSYQLATMSAMVDGMGDLASGMDETQSQVVMAQKVAGQSAKEWRRVQELEIKRWQQSVSGRFKATLESVKASLADAGEPFLNVANKALAAVDKILSGFNSLSDQKKNLIAYGAIFIGMAGPVIMLTGLLANLVANGGLLVAWALKAIGRFDLLNKAEWAQIKLDQQLAQSKAGTTSAIQTQTQQLTALTAAMTAHNAAMARAMGPDPVTGMPFGHGIAGFGPPPKPFNVHQAGAAQISSQWYDPKKNAFRDPDTGRFMKQQAAELKAKKIYFTQIADAQGMTTRQAFMENRARERTNSLLSGGNVAMGAMAASTVLMVQQSSETGNNIGQWLMMLAIGVPALKGLVGGAGAVATKFGEAYTNLSKTSAATAKVGGKAGKLASLGGRFGAAMGGARVAALGLMGPVGWTATAIGTAAFGAYKWWQHEKEITKQKREQANAIYDQNNLLSEQLKINAKQKSTLSVTGANYTAEGLPSPAELADEMKKSDAYKPLIEQLKSGSGVEQEAIAMQKYRDILESTGGSAVKARLYLEALFRASGDGALEAQRRAAEFGSALQNVIDPSEQTDIWGKQFASIFNDEDMDSIKEQGENVGKDLANAIAAGGRYKADATFGKFASLISEKFTGVFEAIPEDLRGIFEEVGISTDAAMQEFVVQFNNAEDKVQFLEDNDIGAQLLPTIDNLVGATTEWGKASAFEAGVVKEIGAQLGVTESTMENINTLAQLRNTWEWKLATANQANAKALYDQRLALFNALNPMKALFGAQVDMNDESKLALANQILANAGLGESKTLTQALAMLAGTWKDEVAGVAGAANSALTPMQRLLNSFKIEDSDFKGILQSGMEGVTGDLADAASETFESRMDSAIEGAQAAWDRRIEALNERHERAMDAFDARWERRRERVEAAYDAQIEGIDKAIEKEEKAEELRQRLFEAEMTRIERLKQAANANIDFNVALRTGDLDEAARIQNDMAAQAQEWALSDAAAAGKARSEAKIDALGASKDEIEEAKDKRLEAMAEIEEKQREHLQKMQEQEEKSLSRRAENAMENMRDQWEAERKNLNDKLDLFRLYTAKNKKDLDRWLAEVGLSYDDFGNSTMMKGEDWAGAIQNSLKKHVRAAGMEIANSSMWEQWADQQAKKTLQGMGFGGMGQFKRFIMTGELPSNFGKNRQKPVEANTGGVGSGPGTMGGNDMMRVHHAGGIVGKSASSRTGVARTAGIHQSEQMVLAQKGEGILTRDAVSRYGTDIVDRMNKGQFEGGAMGPAGFMAAMASRGLISGVSKSFENAVQAKKAQMAAQSMMGVLSGTGALGSYTNLGPVKPWVLEAANYLGGKFGIATIGGVGDRASNPTSDHPKGLALDFMTGDNIALGDAIAKEALRIQDVLDATYMIFNGRIHSFDQRGWRPYSHPSGATDDTSMHRDHVHISFETAGRTGDLPSLVNVGPGGGGKHAPADPGKGWRNTHDYANAENSRLYAFNDAKVIESRAVTSGGSPGNGLYPTPYRSYGETMVLQDANGNKVRYAHLAPGKRFFNVGDVVPGGTIIGLSGMTGNASGPHTHYEWNGSYNAQGGFAGYGIPLRSGGFIKKDGVPATLHKDEQVVDKKRTKKLYGWVDNFDSVASPWFNTMGATLNAKGMPMFDMPTTEGADKDKETGSGKGATVRSGTYNLYRKSSNEASIRDLSRLFGMADILSLTELIGHKRGLIPWIQQQGWGIHTGKGSNDAGLVWNKSKMNLLKGGFHNLPGSGGGAFRDRMAAWGQFRTNSGALFNQISAHTIGMAQGGGAGMKSQYAALGGLIKELTQTGLPLILGGDLNTRKNQGMQDFGLKGMTNTGLQHVLGTVAGKTRLVGGLSSDHPAVLSTFDIPALSKGAQNIRWDNTLANLHAGESVLTEDLTRQFKQGVSNFANGGQTSYNINVVLNEADMSPEELAYKIQRIQQRAEARVAPRRTNR